MVLLIRKRHAFSGQRLALKNPDVTLMTQLSGLHCQGYMTGCSGLAHSGFGRRANHLDGDSRRTPRKPAMDGRRE